MNNEDDDEELTFISIAHDKTKVLHHLIILYNVATFQLLPDPQLPHTYNEHVHPSLSNIVIYKKKQVEGYLHSFIHVINLLKEFVIP